MTKMLMTTLVRIYLRVKVAQQHTYGEESWKSDSLFLVSTTGVDLDPKVIARIYSKPWETNSPSTRGAVKVNLAL